MQGALLEPRGRIARAAREDAAPAAEALAFGIVIRPGAAGAADEEWAPVRPYVRLKKSA